MNRLKIGPKVSWKKGVKRSADANWWGESLWLSYQVLRVERQPELSESLYQPDRERG